MTTTTTATPITEPTVTYDAKIATTFKTNAEKVLANAKGFTIDSTELYAIAAEDLGKVKGLQQQVEAARTSITKPLNAALKAVNDLFREPAQYLVDAETALKRAMGTWDTLQLQLAEKARKEAEELARIERERLAKIAAEAQALADAAAAQAAQAVDNLDGDAAIAATLAAEQAQQAAEEATTLAAVTTVTPRYEAPAATAGIAKRTTYEHTVTNLMDLVKAVAEGKAPIEALQSNATFLRQQATAFKKVGQLYPGVSVTASQTIAARAR